MSSYQELVQHRLAVLHAGIEMKLARAREQKPFIAAVDLKLSATCWPYTMTMTPNFGVVFRMAVGKVDLKHQYQAVKQALAESFEVEFGVENGRPRLTVGCRQERGLQCSVVFGDDDGL